MTASLHTASGTCSAAQRKRLVIVARRAGFSVDSLRDHVGGKLHDLSSAEASSWITRLGGGDLDHPPGTAPRRKTERKKPGVIRMITPAQCEQITRLGAACFGAPEEAFSTWLKKNFKVSDAHALGTARRGGEVIAVLKRIQSRKKGVNP